MREGRGFRKRDKKKPQSLVYQDFGVVAEKEGFEPSKRFCRLHDFQSCALDQLGDFSIAVPVLLCICPCVPPCCDSVIIIAKDSRKSSPISNFFKSGGHLPSAPRVSAFQKQCCPRHDPRRHPACGYFCPPAFSWDLCRRAPSFPLPRRPSIRRPYRPKIRYTSSFQSLLFGLGIV